MTHTTSAISDGFTIVEMMIVLAIAGVIMLLIFETVPVLERTNRNGQRKQDVAAVLSAVSHYELSNGGILPASGPASPLPGGSGLLDYTKLTYYDPAQVTVNLQSPNGAAAIAPSTNVDTVQIYDYAVCDTLHGSSAVGADYRSVVALYATEDASGPSGSPQCQQL